MARYRGRGMRSILAALLLVGCTCTGLPSGEDTEAAARGALTRNRMTDIELVRVDRNTFDFTSRQGELECEGTIVVHRAEGSVNSAIRSSCE